MTIDYATYLWVVHGCATYLWLLTMLQTCDETESTAGNQAVRQVSGPSRRPSGTSLGVAKQVVCQNLLVSTSRKATGLAKVQGAGAWGPGPQGLGP